MDGDLEQIDLEAWKQMELELAEEPEDWTGPVDDIETDDLGYTETGMSADDWREPLRESHAPEGERWQDTRPEGERWQDTRPEDERDEGEGASATDAYGAEHGR